VYQLNPDANNVGVLSFIETLNFADRSWQFEFHNLLVTDDAIKAADGSILAALIIAIIVIVIVTILFVRNRLHSEKQEQAANLLSMVVPDHITKELVSHVRMQDDGKFALDEDTLIARAHRRVALCFIDICDFTAIASVMTPNSAVRFLDEFVTLIDNLVDRHTGVTKIKTIGDAYFAVAGLTAEESRGSASEMELAAIDHEQVTTAVDNLISLIDFCLDVHDTIERHQFATDDVERNNDDNDPDDAEQQRLRVVLNESFNNDDGYLKICVRIGIHWGDIVAGIVGSKQPQYDIWGSVCNHALHMESSAVNGTIQVSQEVYNVLEQSNCLHKYHFEQRRVTMKESGRITTYLLSRVNGRET